MTLDKAVEHCINHGVRFRKINEKGLTYCTLYNPNEIKKSYCPHLCVSRVQVKVCNGVLVYNACDYRKGNVEDEENGSHDLQ